MTKTYASLMILLSGLLSGTVPAAESAPAAGVPASDAAAPAQSAVTAPAAPAAMPMPEATAPAPTAQQEAAPPAASPVAKAAPAQRTRPQDASVPAPEASLVDMVRALSQFLTEDEVQMVYDYLWDSSIASLKGSDEEITLPPELAFKLAILQRRIVKEGGHYLEGLALKMEKDLARWQENMNTPAPPVPYSLPSERDKATPTQP